MPRVRNLDFDFTYVSTEGVLFIYKIDWNESVAECYRYENSDLTPIPERNFHLFFNYNKKGRWIIFPETLQTEVYDLEDGNILKTKMCFNEEYQYGWEGSPTQSTYRLSIDRVEIIPSITYSEDEFNIKCSGKETTQFFEVRDTSFECKSIVNIKQSLLGNEKEHHTLNDRAKTVLDFPVTGKSIFYFTPREIGLLLNKKGEYFLFYKEKNVSRNIDISGEFMSIVNDRSSIFILTNEGEDNFIYKIDVNIDTLNPSVVKKKLESDDFVMEYYNEKLVLSSQKLGVIIY